MKSKATYKALLRFADGSHEIIEIPGREDEKGSCYVPESVTFRNTFFLLNRGVRGRDWFEYLEIPKRTGPVPYRSDLH